MSPLSGAASASLAPPPIEPVRIDGYQQAMEAALVGHRTASPDAAGRALLDGLQSFHADETGFRSAVDAALAPAGANGAPPVGAGSSLVAPGDAAPKDATIAQGEALQRRSLGVMMQTYSFALEATLVTNAATTFTSSVNTLIKTQ